jgi:hypothetical protein
MAKGQKTGGRQSGTPNKVQREDRKLAQKFGPKAIEQIAAMAGLTKNGEGKAEAEATRLGALNAILDRAYGKPAQTIGGDDDLPAIRAALSVAFVGPKSG